mmetsp:Transcript_12090/g.33441  ORF Transcript_12090/g.33441 Transcript_12090/m.33441 type:complete len:278 (+) Transcript_12090:133-966(+)
MQGIDGHYVTMRIESRKVSAREADINIHGFKRDSRSCGGFTFGSRHTMMADNQGDKLVALATSSEEEGENWYASLIEPAFESTRKARMEFLIEGLDPGCNIMFGLVDADAAEEWIPIWERNKARIGTGGQSLCILREPPGTPKRRPMSCCLLYLSTMTIFGDKAVKYQVLKVPARPRVNMRVGVKFDPASGNVSFSLEGRTIGRVNLMQKLARMGRHPERFQFAVDLGPQPLVRQQRVAVGVGATLRLPTTCSLAMVEGFLEKTSDEPPRRQPAAAP